MPRETISTSYIERVKPTTVWDTNHRSICETWDTATFTWDSTLLEWNDSCTAIETTWDEIRKIAVFELENWDNMELENWKPLELEWWLKSNKIDTKWK